VRGAALPTTISLLLLVGCESSATEDHTTQVMRAVGVISYVWITAMLLAPPFFLVTSWTNFRSDKTSPFQEWRRRGFLAGLLAAAGAWLLLAVFTVPALYLNHTWVVAEHGLPVGFVLSIAALALSSFGRGSARADSLINALLLCGLYLLGR
jgi:hypothetical protein